MVIKTLNLPSMTIEITDVDILLYYMVDKRYSFKELESLGFETDFIDKVFTRVQRNQFKRTMPPVAKVSGLNFSFPGD